MAPPQVTIYVTSLTSQPKVRHHTELLHRSLKGLDIPYEAYDLVMDQDAKTRWQRSKPPGQVIGLPGYLVGGEWVGTMEDFEHAVESQTLPSFLKQDQDHGTASTTTSMTDTPGTVGQSELERLMREMSDADLDALASQLGVEDKAGKVGLMVPEGAEPLDKNTRMEELGVKGTGEVVENSNLDLEKKMAEVEIGGKIAEEPKVPSSSSGSSGTGTGAGVGSGLVEKLEKVEEKVLAAATGDEPAAGGGGKEKLD